MGRRKVEIKRIENKSNRQITFFKRRNGLMEKARQLSILCGSSVALFIISATGKLYSFSSGESMTKIISHYKIQHPDDFKTLDLEERTRNYLSHKDLLDIIQCKLEETKSENVSIDCLKSLEEQLKTALSVTRARKTELMMEIVKTLQEKGNPLREENKVLISQLTKIRKIKKCLETMEARAMSPENKSENNQLDTLHLLK